MRIAYLDQNKWIDFARAHHGKETDSAVIGALTAVRAATVSGALALPLSGIHYMETARIKDPARRARLGAVMWELSRGQTFASYRSILVNELELALSRRFPQVVPRPFVLVSKGIAHAFGMDVRPFRLPPPVRLTLPETAVSRLEAGANEAIERALITGEGPPGVDMLSFGTTEHNRRFKEHLETLHPRLAQLPAERWDDALYAISIVDILEPLNEVMAVHGLQTHDIARDKEQFGALIDELPSRRVDLQLHRQLLRNPALRPRITDLEDYGGLAPAAAHCDIVVCEKHFADLVLRSGFTPKALILTDVRELPTALRTLSAT